MCDKSCDNRFLFCLRTYGYNKTNEHCPLGSYQTGTLGNNAITFSAPTLDTGISNPMNFTGASWLVSNCTVMMHTISLNNVGIISALCQSDR